jgi:hypothetical protein
MRVIRLRGTLDLSTHNKSYIQLFHLGERCILHNNVRAHLDFRYIK